jgi:heme exporter protein C
VNSATKITNTSTRGSRVLGIATLVGIVATLLFALVLSPEDATQHDSVRFLYLHVPAAIATYLAFAVTALGSIMFLWKRTRSLTWDRVAGCSAEIGIVFTGLMLVTGMMWGRLTWGVYWRWDARMAATALLFVMFVAYLAVRRLEGTPEQRAKRSAFVGIIAFLDVPIVHKSVDWWTTLHQQQTLKLGGDTTLSGIMLFSFFLGLITILLAYVWLMLHRNRIAMMEQALDDHGLQIAIQERRSEAVRS